MFSLCLQHTEVKVCLCCRPKDVKIRYNFAALCAKVAENKIHVGLQIRGYRDTRHWATYSTSGWKIFKNAPKYIISGSICL